MTAALALPAPALPPALLDKAEPCLLPRQWREEVEAWTRRHREDREREHARRAWSAAKLSTATWHANRAKGQRQRFFRLANCGEQWTVEGSCSACGTVTTRKVTCGLVNLCPRCRGREARRLRQRVREMMRELPAEYEEAVSNGGWGWRFLTLTVPHGRGIKADVRDLRTRLWPAFVRQLRAHIRIDLGFALRPLFARTLEINAADSADDGHAHYHIALLMPYVSRNLLGLWWGKEVAKSGRNAPAADVAAILDGSHPGAREEHPFYRERVAGYFVTRRGACGRPLADSCEAWQPATGKVPFPVVDFRRVEGDVSRELVKYLVKDVSREGKRISPRVFAKVYEAVDGARRMSQSKPLRRPERQPCPCPECKAPGEAMEWATVNHRPEGRLKLSSARNEYTEEMRRAEIERALSILKEMRQRYRHGAQWTLGPWAEERKGMNQ